MLKITESEYKEKLDLLPADLQDKLLMLSYDDTFLRIINGGVIKSEDAVADIDYATRMTALGFMSKEEMFNTIYGGVEDDEDEARRIFKALDETILVPNNLEGAPEQDIKEDEEDGEGKVSEKTENELAREDNKYSENTTETAEDILREIENPTTSISTISEPKKEKPTNTDTGVNPVQQNTTTPTEVVPEVIKPTENTLATEPKVPNKESQLDSKLTEPVVQPAKSTYYKVDPYREQPEP